ncbi:MAG: hypothetical protein GEU91_00250 [Rhizobiales bacterium]|nr:hypothetical protein [Hyphomicrobiales bacterium]
MKTSTKIWLGVGAFVVAGTGAIPAEPNPAGAASPVKSPPMDARAPAVPRTATSAIVLAQHMRHGAEGGEGEGGEGGSAKLPPDLQFGLRIAQMRGHLLVGNQLVDERQWNAALPHFLHPSEEIYGAIRGHLKDYGVAPFEATLKVLANTVKRKKGGADYAKALKTVQDALAKADAGLKTKGVNWAPFTVELALELLKSAAGEYEEAIVKGRIGKPVEYQDARGFVWEATAMIESVSAALDKKDARALKDVQARLADLKAVFPSAMPPKQPMKNHADVLAMIAQVELAAGPLM